MKLARHQALFAKGRWITKPQKKYWPQSSVNRITLLNMLFVQTRQNYSGKKTWKLPWRHKIANYNLSLGTKSVPLRRLNLTAFRWAVSGQNNMPESTARIATTTLPYLGLNHYVSKRKKVQDRRYKKSVLHWLRLLLWWNRSQFYARYRLTELQ